MLSSILAVVLFFNVFSIPPVYAEEDEATTSPTTIREVKLDSIDSYRKAREEAMKQREEAMEELRVKKTAAIREWETRREEFREKIAEIKDERKQKILENIDERIVKVNEKWVEHWNNVLSRLSEILVKIEERSGGEVDTGAAEAAIAAAQEAVNTQAGKTYEIVIEDEETLGENVSETLGVFHEDLREVQALIKTAREEVVKALRELKGMKVNESEEDE